MLVLVLSSKWSELFFYVIKKNYKKVKSPSWQCYESIAWTSKCDVKTHSQLITVSVTPNTHSQLITVSVTSNTHSQLITVSVTSNTHSQLITVSATPNASEYFIENTETSDKQMSNAQIAKIVTDSSPIRWSGTKSCWPQRLWPWRKAGKLSKIFVLSTPRNNTLREPVTTAFWRNPINYHRVNSRHSQSCTKFRAKERGHYEVRIRIASKGNSA